MRGFSDLKVAGSKRWRGLPCCAASTVSTCQMRHSIAKADRIWLCQLGSPDSRLILPTEADMTSTSDVAQPDTVTSSVPESLEARQRALEASGFAPGRDCLRVCLERKATVFGRHADGFGSEKGLLYALHFPEPDSDPILEDIPTPCLICY